MSIPFRNPEDLAEAADVALANRDYARAESIARAALHGAVALMDWHSARHALRPLQEAVRWRRQNAADAGVRLGSSDETDPRRLVEKPGLLLLTHPHDAATAAQLRTLAAERGHDVVVLVADNPETSPLWHLGSITRPAPPAAWRGRRLEDATQRPAAVHYFITFSEQAGDAAFLHLPTEPEPRIRAIMEALDLFDDHELLHQALAASLMAITHPSSASPIK